MTTKRKRISHVPEMGKVITEPSIPSSLDRAAARTATEPVTLDTLAGDLENLKTQIAIMVEWLQSLDERAASGG